MNAVDKSTMRPSLLFSLALATYCFAAPHTKSQSQCKPFGESTKLLSYNSQDNTLLYFQSSAKGHNPKLLAQHQSDEKFQFYQCHPPSKEYRQSGKNVVYGQLHSVTHPGKCLTAGNTRVLTGQDAALDPTFDYIPTSDGTIRMYDCETADTDIMRRQWMGLVYSKEKNPSCKLPKLFQAGRKKDYDLYSLEQYTQDKASSFALPWKYATSFAYLQNRLPKECKE